VRVADESEHIVVGEPDIVTDGDGFTVTFIVAEEEQPEVVPVTV
jgi:hypothetical protein